MSNPLPALTRHLSLSSDASSGTPAETPARSWIFWSLLLAGLTLALFILGFSIQRKNRHRRPALW
ncbi:MAG: hypothetical protein IGS03_03390 [Candidatus Sericytochromatia bacterium]|nr:hypothetical protein [Candidatus Sericytochromatia bacterium]